ncbi:MAG TPA: sulfotransferase [Solirubrobacteraceae bacterium]|nr:sulfotransferase [Solirubrobacteraceae bacterium]
MTVQAEPPTSAAVGGATAPPAGRLPDFFIVGHPKCGTTALHQMLSRHQQIHMPLKEPRFFAPELRSRYRRLGPQRLPEALDAYLELFAGARPDQLAGEASPQYLRSRTAAARIADVQPTARIIAILREPASFLRSFHLQAVHNNVETVTDFAKAIALEDDRRAGRRVPLLSQAPAALLYSDHVRYVEQLRRFHAAFGAEQVLVLIYDDFRADNEGTVRRVLRFLDVDDSVPIEPIQTERLSAVRSPLLYRAGIAASLVRRRAFGGAPRARRRLTPSPWQRLVFREPDPPDEALMRELRARFKPEVVAVSEYLGRDLVSQWGYDAVA